MIGLLVCLNRLLDLPSIKGNTEMYVLLKIDVPWGIPPPPKLLLVYIYCLLPWPIIRGSISEGSSTHSAENIFGMFLHALLIWLCNHEQRHAWVLLVGL